MRNDTSVTDATPDKANATEEDRWFESGASYVWWKISGWLNAGIFVSPFFYPLGIVRGGGWITAIWIMLGVSVVSMPFVSWIDGFDRSDVWRRRAAHALGVAAMAVVISWWGVMSRPPVFAAVYPLVLTACIVECVFLMKRRVRPENRRRLMAAAAVASGLAATAAVAKLVYISRGGANDGVPIVVNWAVAFAGVTLSIWIAQAPRGEPMLASANAGDIDAPTPASPSAD